MLQLRWNVNKIAKLGLNDYVLGENNFFIKNLYISSNTLELVAKSDSSNLTKLDPDVIKEHFKFKNTPPLEYDATAGEFNGIIGSFPLNFNETLIELSKQFYGFDNRVKNLDTYINFNTHINSLYDLNGNFLLVKGGEYETGVEWDTLCGYEDLLELLKAICESFATEHGVDIAYNNPSIGKTRSNVFVTFIQNVKTFLDSNGTEDHLKKYEIIKQIAYSFKMVVQQFKNIVYYCNAELKDATLNSITLNGSIMIENLKFNFLNFGEDKYQGGMPTYLKNVRVMKIQPTFNYDNKNNRYNNTYRYIFLEDVTFQKTIFRNAELNGFETIFAKNTIFSTTDVDDLKVAALHIYDSATQNSIPKSILSQFNQVNNVLPDFDPFAAVGVSSIDFLNFYGSIEKKINENSKGKSRYALYTAGNADEIIGSKYTEGLTYDGADENMIAQLAGLLIK